MIFLHKSPNLHNNNNNNNNNKLLKWKHLNFGQLHKFATSSLSYQFFQYLVC